MTTTNTIISATRDNLTTRKNRTAWEKGVTAYALDLLDDLEEYISGGYFDPSNLGDKVKLKEALLNGASDWKQYSWGGSSLIHNFDIAKRLCTPSELKKTRNGEHRPNSQEEWLDTQARALCQAFRVLSGALRFWVEEMEDETD